MTQSELDPILESQPILLHLLHLPPLLHTTPTVLPATSAVKTAPPLSPAYEKNKKYSPRPLGTSTSHNHTYITHSGMQGGGLRSGQSEAVTRAQGQCSTRT